MNQKRAITYLVVAAALAVGLYLLELTLNAWQSGDETLPPLLADLPQQDTQAAFSEGDAMFNIRLSEAFGPGTQTDDLIQRLRDNGFAIHGSKATRDSRQFLCDLHWEVLWQDNAGTAEGISGSYSGACM